MKIENEINTNEVNIGVEETIQPEDTIEPLEPEIEQEVEEELEEMVPFPEEEPIDFTEGELEECDDEPKIKTYLKLKPILLFLFLIILTATTVFSAVTLYNGEWVCIAKQCSNWVEGDEWVATFCRPENDTLMCNVEIQNQQTKVPLSSLNISNLKSCGEYGCVAKIYVKASEEIKQD